MADATPLLGGNAEEAEAGLWLREAEHVEVELDVLRRMQLTPDRKLARVVRCATSKQEYTRMMELRGYELVEVQGVEITADRPFEALLEVMERSDENQDIKLTFRPPDWPGSPAEAERQKQNNLFSPQAMVTELTTDILLQHLYIQRSRRVAVIKDLSKVPSGMCFYFNHPFWSLSSLGALLELRPNTLRELDLSNNKLSDVGDDLSRFEQLTELRLEGNRLTTLELHHMPRLTSLYLASNQLRVLPELLGMPSLQRLDLGENLIGSRTAGEGIRANRGESPDGWESLAHSPLPELKLLLLPNNQLTWTQVAFNERIARLADKQSLTALDLRGNPFLFQPRLDDQPSIRMYREWILTQCPRLKVLDEEEVGDQERLRMLLEPMKEPFVDVGADESGQPVGGTEGGRFPRFQYFGNPKLSPLPVHADMLAATFSLPSRMVVNVLQRIQDSLQNLFHAPPQARFFFEPDGGFEALIGAEIKAAAAVDKHTSVEARDALNDESANEGPTGRFREARKHVRLAGEAQLARGNGLLKDSQVEAEEEAFQRFYTKTARGLKELDKEESEMSPIPIAPLPAEKLAPGEAAAAPIPAAIVDVASPGGGEGIEPSEAARNFRMPLPSGMGIPDRRKRDGYQVISEVIQQLVLIFDRAPIADQVTTMGAERALAAEAAGAMVAISERIPAVATRDERLGIAQRAVRLLTTCAAMGGDDHWGDVLAREALEALLELLHSSEQQENMIINEALAVLMPPVVSTQCFDWVQWSHFEMMVTLVSIKPQVGLQLSSLAPTLQRIAAAELGTGPTPLYQLMGKLARYEDDFPRTKGVKGVRADSMSMHSPAHALHAAGVTDTVAGLIKAGPDKKRAMDSWTPSRQICVWQVVEGLARHVPQASLLFVEMKADVAVKNELLEHLGGGRAKQAWKRPKTRLVAQLIATVEALGRHSTVARRTLFALPPSYGNVLGDEYPKYDEEKCALLLHVLPLINGNDRLDAVMLTECLHLLGSLVLTGNGFMLNALYKILFEKGMLMLRLAQPSSQGGVLDKVAARAAQWALATKCERGSATEEERMAHDELVRDLELGLSRQHGGMSVETVDDGAVLQMLRALVRVMTAFAQRAEDYQQSKDRYLRGEGAQPDDRLEIASRVTELFDENSRDKIIFGMLSNTNDALCIEAMQCLATVPTESLEADEVQVLVEFVHEKMQTHQMYVGRNEEMLMHAFGCFARVVRVPDIKDVDKKGKKGKVAKSTGTAFREKNGDLVQVAISLLVDNTKREIPQSASAERAQKARLSTAITHFLQACSGPDSDYDADDQDAPRVWLQAVSVLQMRDATNSMVEVMRNEERFGERSNGQKLELEKSAMADTIEPLLYTLPQVQPTGLIKARLLNRLAELLEPVGGVGDAASEQLFSSETEEPTAGRPESAEAKRKRMQGHVSFLRRNGVDLVLTQLENQLSEFRQMNRGSGDAFAGGDADGFGSDELLPPDASSDRTQRSSDALLSFVQFENNLKEAGLADVEEEDDIVPTEEQQRKDIEAGVDWHNVGIGSLFTEKLHLMADQGEDTGASANSFGGSKGGVLTVKSLSGMESDNERLGAEQQKNVEDSISATFRVLSACVRYGSPETKLGFLKRFSQLSMQQDVLKLAGYASIFTPKSRSSATAGVKETDVALRFVTMWNAVLHAMDEEHMITVEQLPLLETLAALLPRLLDPLAVKMGSLLDLWRRTGKRDGFSAANQELLNKTMLSTEPPSYTKMLSALHGVSGLYSRMLCSIEALNFSKEQMVDVAAKELALRRLLPPSHADSQRLREYSVDDGVPNGGRNGHGHTDEHGGHGRQPSSPAAAAMAKGAQGSALLAFLSALFFDVVLRLAEGWHAGGSSVGRSDVDKLTRQDAMNSIKVLLAAFCVIDEERRFELFQLTARLEARWGFTLPPALMSAIKSITAEELYKRALFPFLTKTAFVLEPDGERILEATWMVQELPRRMRAPSVMLVVTNRAIYLLEPTTAAVCNVCEPWKLCPAGPRLRLRVPFYRLKKIVLDFATKYQCGQRMKLVCMQAADEARARTPAATDGGFFGFCRSCMGGPLPPESPGGSPESPGGSPDGSPKKPLRPKPANVELQFSTLHVGVVERLTRTIRRMMEPRPIEVVRDMSQLRALAISSYRSSQGGDEGAASQFDVLASTIDPVELLLNAPFVYPRFAVRCERLPIKGARQTTKSERLLVLTDSSISIFTEEPEHFHAVLAEEESATEEGSNKARAPHSTAPSAEQVTKLEMRIELGSLEMLELEMCEEPRVLLAGDGKSVTLQFADDTAALLFRMHMRSLLWDMGRVEWRAHTILQADS